MSKSIVKLGLAQANPPFHHEISLNSEEFLIGTIRKQIQSCLSLGKKQVANKRKLSDMGLWKKANQVELSSRLRELLRMKRQYERNVAQVRIGIKAGRRAAYLIRCGQHTKWGGWIAPAHVSEASEQDAIASAVSVYVATGSYRAALHAACQTIQDLEHMLNGRDCATVKVVAMEFDNGAELPIAAPEQSQDMHLDFVRGKLAILTAMRRIGYRGMPRRGSIVSPVKAASAFRSARAQRDRLRVLARVLLHGESLALAMCSVGFALHFKTVRQLLISIGIHLAPAYFGVSLGTPPSAERINAIRNERNRLAKAQRLALAA